MLAAIAPIFTLDQRPAALQRLLMHEIGHALGLQHPNEFAASNRDTDTDPLNVMTVDPADPLAGLQLSPNVDRDAVMSNRYARKDLLPDGVRTLTLKPGADGKARARLAARGTRLAPPTPPLALPLTVQLGSRDVPLCLAASFDAGAVKRNEAGKLKAKTSPD